MVVRKLDTEFNFTVDIAPDPLLLPFRLGDTPKLMRGSAHATSNFEQILAQLSPGLNEAKEI
jgi:hypothetical protein